MKIQIQKKKLVEAYLEIDKFKEAMSKVISIQYAVNESLAVITKPSDMTREVLVDIVSTELDWGMILYSFNGATQNDLVIIMKKVKYKDLVNYSFKKEKQKPYEIEYKETKKSGEGYIILLSMKHHNVINVDWNIDNWVGNQILEYRK